MVFCQDICIRRAQQASRKRIADPVLGDLTIQFHDALPDFVLVWYRQHKWRTLLRERRTRRLLWLVDIVLRFLSEVLHLHIDILLSQALTQGQQVR